MLKKILQTVKAYPILSIIVLLPVFTMALLMILLPVSGDDGWVHLNWVGQFTNLIRQGYWYPRWLPDSFAGLGSAAFYFYPPLPYWVLSITSFVLPIANPSTLLYIISFAAGILSTVSALWYFRYLRIPTSPAILGSVLYGFAIYRQMDVFSRNAIGEQCGFIFLPLIFLSLEFALSDNRQERFNSLLLGASAWLGLLLTNIPCVVIAAVASIVYCLAAGIFSRPNRIPLIALTVIGAICCAAIYLVPMVQLQHSVHLEKLWVYNSSAGQYWDFRPEYYDPRSTKTSLIYIGVIASILLYRWIRHNKNNQLSRQTKLFFWLTVLSAGLQLPFIGVILHSEVFPFTILQFYWRWNVLLLFALSGSFAIMLSNKTSMWFQYAVPGLFCLRSILLTGFLYLKATPITVDWRHLDVDEYIPATVPYFRYDMEKVFKTQQGPKPMIESTDSISYEKLDSYTIKIKTMFAEPHRQTVNLFYWPEWKLRTANGSNLPTTPDSMGFLTATIPSGKQELTLRLEQSDSEKTGTTISLAGFAFIGALILIYRPKR